MKTEGEQRLEEINRLLEAPGMGPEVSAALRATVQLLIDSAYNPVREARAVIRRAFLEDPAFLKVYQDNIACWIMDFEARRFAEPSVNPGPLSKSQRDQLAGIILKNLFDL